MIYIQAIADIATPLLTGITVILLFYYTKETFLLRKEAQKQTQSQFTPYLALRNLEGGAAFSNLGKGIAKHVQIVKVGSPIILLIPSVGAGEDRALYRMSENGEGAFSLSARELSDEILVTYSDIIGNEYSASFVREYSGMGVFRERDQGLVV